MTVDNNASQNEMHEMQAKIEQKIFSKRKYLSLVFFFKSFIHRQTIKFVVLLFI